ncbi:MAG: hypothetical protein NTZ35_01505 [Ignavibacteriales bacterium]|nr:hypothetical protein [Ignavibacteriales bacterium]
MNDSSFDHWKIGGGESRVWMNSPELVKELRKACGRGATYEKAGRVIEWQFVVPFKLVRFYYRRFLLLSSQNRVLEGVENERVTEASTKKFARGESSGRKRYIDKPRRASKANRQISSNSRQISKQGKALTGNPLYKEDKT